MCYDIKSFEWSLNWAGWRKFSLRVLWSRGRRPQAGGREQARQPKQRGGRTVPCQDLRRLYRQPVRGGLSSDSRSSSGSGTERGFLFYFSADKEESTAVQLGKSVASRSACDPLESAFQQRKMSLSVCSKPVWRTEDCTPLFLFQQLRLTKGIGEKYIKEERVIAVLVFSLKR